MAGGRGERFWPKSRAAKPKHLLPIVGNKPMLLQTIERLNGLIPLENIWIITHENQIEAVIQACPQILPQQVIGEPLGKDTAAAFVLALSLIKAKDPHALFITLPADHIVHDYKGFQLTLSHAVAVAAEYNQLVTIGIRPSHPATGYGYIDREAKPLIDWKGTAVYRVKHFVEKPNFLTARRYVNSGHYYWNAGIYVLKVDILDQALKDHLPAYARLSHDLLIGLQNKQPMHDLLLPYYKHLEKISIDYALIEKMKHILTVEAHFDWDDVGEWPAIARHFPSDTDGNVVLGPALLESSSSNIVVSEDGHVLALVGLDNLIVVHTPQATLICPKHKAQDIKRLVQRIAQDKDYQHLL